MYKLILHRVEQINMLNVQTRVRRQETGENCSMRSIITCTLGNYQIKEAVIGWV
jgi:hypothetical protein